jgi:hypothetical protein
MKPKFFAWMACTFLFFVIFKANPQNISRKTLNIPDIPGYKTLKCDLHMHTVYSDGTVWPTVRVMEAWAGGLDVIAITDHLGKSTKTYIYDSTFTKSYEIAKSYAAKLGIVVIRGTEITKSLSFGHFNALFISDPGLINKENGKDALIEAKKQGAFITWNHPGWRFPNEIPVWDSIHEDLYKNGLFSGIEIVNVDSYYPLALSWANEKKFTLISGSDIHDPVSLEFNETNVEHRPIDLVFAKDTSMPAIKEALMQQRTVIYHKNYLFGKEELLKALFNASVKMLNGELIIDADSKSDYRSYIQLQNNSCIDFELELAEKDKILIVTEKLTLSANSVSLIDLKPGPKNMKGNGEYILKYKVKNLLKAPDDCIIIEIPVKIKYI